MSLLMITHLFNMGNSIFLKSIIFNFFKKKVCGGGVEYISPRRKAFKIFNTNFGVVILKIMVGKVSRNILFCLYSTCLTKSKMHCICSASFTWKLVLNLIAFSIRFQKIQEAGRLLPSHHPSQTLRTYQLSGVREMVGVDWETDMSEDQEAEQWADLEVVIGKRRSW